MIMIDRDVVSVSNVSFDHETVSRRVNININICSIELKWDGKMIQIWYDNDRSR